MKNEKPDPAVAAGFSPDSLLTFYCGVQEDAITTLLTITAEGEVIKEEHYDARRVLEVWLETPREACSTDFNDSRRYVKAVVAKGTEAECDEWVDSLVQSVLPRLLKKKLDTEKEGPK